MSTKELKTTDEFNAAIESGVALVDFNAPWCAPCRAQGPIIDRLSDLYEGKALIAALNVDDNQALAEDLGIQGIPTMVLFKDGEEVRRFVGLQRESSLAESLDKVLEG